MLDEDVAVFVDGLAVVGTQVRELAALQVLPASTSSACPSKKTVSSKTRAANGIRPHHASASYWSKKWLIYRLLSQRCFNG
jgi:hypothetical protein